MYALTLRLRKKKVRIQSLLLTTILFMVITLFSTSAMSVYAQDRSETNTQQGLQQKNDGSGDSTNSNCAQNSIDSSSTILCGEEALPPPTTCVECFTTILSDAEISSFELALSANTGGQLTTVADACAALATNDPPTTVEEARTFLIGAGGVSPEHAQALIDCLVRLGLLNS